MESPTMKIKIDGHPYVLRPRELDAWQTATFEAETGLSVEGMLEALTTRAGRTLTMFARFAFLCTLQSGQEATFREVASRITYGSSIGEPETTGLVVTEEDGSTSTRADAAPPTVDEVAGPEPARPSPPEGVVLDERGLPTVLPGAAVPPPVPSSSDTGSSSTGGAPTGLAG